MNHFDILTAVEANMHSESEYLDAYIWYSEQHSDVDDYEYVQQCAEGYAYAFAGDY